MAASSFFDRVKVAVASAPGTGTISLGAAAPGFRSFSQAAVPDGTLVSYVIEDGTSFEVGQGTYAASAGTLARTTISSSSASSNAAITASANAVVYITVTAADLAALGGSMAAAVTPTPVVVQHAQNNTQGNPVPANQPGAGSSVTMGTVPVKGNLLVAIAHAFNYIAAVSSGWTLVLDGGTDPSNHRRMIASKIVAAGEVALQTPFANCSNAVVEIYEVSSYDADDFNGTTSANAVANLTQNTESMTGTLSSVPVNSLVLGMFSSDANMQITINTNVSTDESYLGYIGDYCYDQAFHVLVTTAGTVTESATSQRNSNQVVVMVAIRPHS